MDRVDADAVPEQVFEVTAEPEGQAVFRDAHLPACLSGFVDALQLLGFDDWGKRCLGVK